MLCLQYQHPRFYDILATKQHKQNDIRKNPHIFVMSLHVDDLPLPTLAHTQLCSQCELVLEDKNAS